MPYLRKITIKNFKCFRREVTIDLDQATYLVGPNNAGKTAVLSALRCFFDSVYYKGEFLNKTEFASKQAGFNLSEISIEFDLSFVTGETRKKKFITKYGKTVTIKKTFTFREAANNIIVEYHLGDIAYPFIDAMDVEAREILSAVSLSYIHPQEGADLLAKAQEKFKQRLFHNWGRHASVATQIDELQRSWNDLRKTANTYLSKALTDRLKLLWPQSSIKVDLPEQIEDVVAISDITFRTNNTLPEVTLTSQGTGAQSAVLYQTHYILDSDRSLHKGFYVPVWLLEEPESFLHTDIAVKLGGHLASDEWLNSIQMVISTHSPVILATSRLNEKRARWVTIDAHAVSDQKRVDAVNDADIGRIGRMMGDPNFDAYFSAAQRTALFFIEDVRDLTRSKLEEMGIKVTKPLNGSSEVKKYIEVFRTVPGVVPKKAFFLLDNDKGIKEIRQQLESATKLQAADGIELLDLGNGVHVLRLPDGFAMEDLFDEFDDELDACVKELYDHQFNIRASIPSRLSRTAGVAKGKGKLANADEAKALIRNHQEVKDGFWDKVGSNNYRIADRYATALKKLTGME